MCLTVKSELKRAKQDLYTIKFVLFHKHGISSNKPEIKYTTYYRDKELEFNKVYTADLSIKKKIRESVYVGFHSFNAIPHRKYNIFMLNGNFSMRYHRCVICKIPKGSLYYLGDAGDIVSNQMIMHGDITKAIIHKNTSRILFKTVLKKGLDCIAQSYNKQTF